MKCIMYDFIYIKSKNKLMLLEIRIVFTFEKVVMIGEWSSGDILQIWVSQVCSVFEKSSSHIFMMCTFSSSCALCFNKLLIFFNFQRSFKAKILRKRTLPSILMTTWIHFPFDTMFLPLRLTSAAHLYPPWHQVS